MSDQWQAAQAAQAQAAQAAAKAEEERKAAVKTEYEQRKERTAQLTNLTLQATDGNSQQPTPTQEENDLAALGLLHPDEKSNPPANPMPPLAAQQAYLREGTALPSAPAPVTTTATTAPRTTTTTTTAPRTTSTTSGSTGASGA
jgi:hypothetical protein